MSRSHFRLKHLSSGLYLDCCAPGKNLVDCKVGQYPTLQRRKSGAAGKGQRFYVCEEDLRVYNEYGLVLDEGRVEQVLMLASMADGDRCQSIHFNNDGRIGFGEKNLLRILVPEGQNSGSQVRIKDKEKIESADEIWKKVPLGSLMSSCVCM